MPTPRPTRPGTKLEKIALWVTSESRRLAQSVYSACNKRITGPMTTGGIERATIHTQECDTQKCDPTVHPYELAWRPPIRARGARPRGGASGFGRRGPDIFRAAQAG